MVIELNLAGRKLMVDGQITGLTNREAQICKILSERQNQVVSRSRFLDLLSLEGNETLTDRGLDNIISRLRKKLSDTGPSPQVIETLYGEGYRWIYRPLTNSVSGSQSRVFLNDLSNSEFLSNNQRKDFLEQLKTELASKLNYQIDFAEFSADITGVDASKPSFCIEVMEIKNANDHNIALNIRRLNSDHFISLGHHRINDPLLTPVNLEALCNRIYSFIIQTDITSNTNGFTTVPLDVALFDTADRYESNPPAHRITRDHLNRIMAEAPDDPHAKILLALNMSNRLLMGYVRDYREKSELMCQLAQAAIPELENDALYLAAGAEVLYQCGFKEQGIAFADKAHAMMTHPAATLKAVGKMHAFEGHFEHARQCYEQATAMTQLGSTFHYMLLTLKAISYKAEGKNGELGEIMKDIFQLEPKMSKRIILKLMLNDSTAKLNFAERTLIKAMPKRLLDRIVQVTYVGSARSFTLEKHRNNIMEPLLDLLFKLRHYKTMDPEIIASLPSYFK